jgi:predicted RNA binding protein YcfA (HicA-like mRNA interferase family)
VKSVSGKEFTKILERNGWALLRINGSHHIDGKSGSVARISIPVHVNASLKTGLLRNIMKLAEITEDDL